MRKISIPQAQVPTPSIGPILTSFFQWFHYAECMDSFAPLKHVFRPSPLGYLGMSAPPRYNSLIRPRTFTLTLFVGGRSGF